MRSSLTNHDIFQPWSPMHAAGQRKKSRARSSHPTPPPFATPIRVPAKYNIQKFEMFFHAYNVYCKRPECLCQARKNSMSQPTLSHCLDGAHHARLPHSLATKAAMLTDSPSVSVQHTNNNINVKPKHSFGNERFDENDIVEDASGSILSGSTEALVRRLLPSRGRAPDDNYVFTLLLNIRTVMSPPELMAKIIQYFMFEQNSASSNFRREGRLLAGQSVLSLMQLWISHLPYDFRSDSMQDRLTELLSMCGDKQVKQKAFDLKDQLNTIVCKAERYERALAGLQKDKERPKRSDDIVGLITVCPTALVVAQQLTHIELERFSMIGADEIVEALSKNDLASLGKQQGSHIGQYVEWFNRLSAIVATEILRNTKKKHKLLVIEFFIDVARECVNVGNFNSLMAIVAGLSLPAVARLKKTWARVEKSKLDVLQHQLDPSGNFLSYRATMKAAVWRADAASGENEKIIIPFFVLLLKDLYLIYHSQPRVLPNGHLNYLAYSQLAENLQNVLRWKNRGCAFPKVPTVLQHLLTTPTYSERSMMLVSFDAEPAECATEKEQHKKLKLEINSNS